MDYPRDLGQVELWQESLERSLARRGQPKRSSVELYRLRGERDLLFDDALPESAQYSHIRRRTAEHPLVPRPAAAVAGVSALTLLAVLTLPDLLGGQSGRKERVTYAANLSRHGRVGDNKVSSSLQPRGTSTRPLVSHSTSVALQSHAAPKVMSLSESLQQLQRRLGVPADGDFGPVTLRAVRAFQASHGVVVDGIVGPATRAALGLPSGPVLRANTVFFPKPVKRAHHVAHHPAPKPVHHATHHATRHVTRPHPQPAPKTLSTFATVRLMQQRLGIPADGQFGPATFRALKAFQADHKLFADGVVGPDTRAALRLPTGAILRANPTYFHHKRVKPAHHVRRTPSKPAHHPTRPHPAPKTLSVIATIRLMQQRLGIPADGQFGPATAKALKAFQSHHGLTADGILGPSTRAALRLPTGAILRADPTYFHHKSVKRGQSVNSAHHVRRTAPKPVHHTTRPHPAPKSLSVIATIRLMQQRLGIPADGQFGPATAKALKAFQSHHGLTADGILGPTTRAALRLPAGPILRPDRALFPRPGTHHTTPVARHTPAPKPVHHSPPPRSSTGYVNPLAHAHVTPERIDMGIDYAGTGTLTALGEGRVTFVGTSGTGWPGAFIEYRLMNGPDAGRYVYYAEGVRPAVSVGQVVQAGQPVAYLIPGWSSGIEIGWGSGIGTSTLAQKLGESSYPTAAGESFSALIASLGGPPGIR